MSKVLDMKRRSFMKTIATSGLALNMPLLSNNAHASSLPGQYLVVVQADGAWDPTSFCDPKGLNQAYADKSELHGGSTNSVALNSAKKIGAIQWSDVPDIDGLEAVDAIRTQDQIDTFFTRYGDRMTIINGIDTSTNNHDVGKRYMWSGNLDVSHPSLAAFYAGAVAPNLPLAFMSNGGFDYTASVVARARTRNPALIADIAAPNLTYGDRNFLYVDGEVDVFAEVMIAQRARLKRQLASEQLERRKLQLSQLFGIRSNEANLGEISPHLRSVRENVLPEDHWNAGRAEGFKKQVQFIASALKAELAVSANLYMVGFDTHDNHDAKGYPLLGDLCEGVHYLMVVLDYLGIKEQTTVVVGSDFGRTPYYNSGKGKDHWPLTSMVVIQGNEVVTGGRVYGATSSDFNLLNVSPLTGLPDEDGLILEASHVNQELRKLLGVADHSLAELFPLPESAFDIFG